MKHNTYYGIISLYLNKIIKKPILILTILFIFLNKTMISLTPFIFRSVIEKISNNTPIQMVTLVILSYGLVRWLSAVFGDGKDFFFVPLEQRAIRSMAEETFSHLQKLSVSFHLNRETGGLMRALEKGMKGIEIFSRFFIFNILPTVLEVLLVCGLLLWKYPPFFASVLFLVLLAYTLFTLFFVQKNVNLFKELNKSDNKSKSIYLDSLINYQTVKIFNQEEEEERKYDYFLANYEKINIKIRLVATVLNIGQSLILSTGLVVLSLKSALAVRQGSMQVADFVLMNTVIIQFIMPLHALGYIYREIKQAVIDIRQMLAINTLPIEPDDESQSRALQLKRGDIRFSNVTFAYRRETPVLYRCSFTIKGGSRVAFVGASGSGKTTLVSLLVRFFDPQDGAIFIDDQDIRYVTRTSLRQAIGVVPQDTVLFNDTIGYNISYGLPGASEEQIIQASKKAQIYNFIMKLPHQYETNVGERGLKLSGGEKQRVAIARVLIKNSSLFVFDEATSALDNTTEKNIHETIFQITASKTTIIIAHRLSTIVHVDHIFVLKDGAVAEEGNHDTLIKKQGLYAQLWQKQISMSENKESIDC